jgi:hypothetical protein
MESFYDQQALNRSDAALQRHEQMHRDLYQLLGNLPLKTRPRCSPIYAARVAAYEAHREKCSRLRRVDLKTTMRSESMSAGLRRRDNRELLGLSWRAFRASFGRY